MKKTTLIITSLVICASIIGINFSPLTASAKTVKKVTTSHSKKKVVSKIKTNMKWTPAALKAIGSFGSFDYNNSIRNAYIKKVEAYAKRKHATVVTPAIVDSFTG